MFVSQQISLPFSARVAQARLVNLAMRGGLGHAARTAYDGEAEQLLRVGPLGQAAGPSKLVRVLFLEPVSRDETVTIGMRWEATGISGTLFPVLDANVSVAPAPDGAAILALEGSYRPPLGGLGASLDKVLLNNLATATIKAMLRDVAAVLTNPGEDSSVQPERASGRADGTIWCES